MKALPTVLLAFAVTLSLAGCNKQATPVPAPSENVSASSAGSEVTTSASAGNETAPTIDDGLEAIRESINDDFADTAKLLTDELEQVDAKISTSYDDYKANHQYLADWYALSDRETKALFERTEAKYLPYYQLMYSTIDHGDTKKLDDATDELYDAVYDGVFDDYYDDIYDDLFDNIYDDYYDGVLDDAYNTAEYEEWSGLRTQAYAEWSDRRTNFYSDWSDARSTFYGTWSAIRSGIYSKNFDAEAILQEYYDGVAAEPTPTSDPGSEATTDADTPSESESSAAESGTVASDSTSTAVDGIRPEFKEMLDNYEAFIDEYVDFMQKYENSDNAVAMLADYASMMTKYATFAQKIDAVDEGDLSDEELAYYNEVLMRVNQKLLAATQ